MLSPHDFTPAQPVFFDAALLAMLRLSDPTADLPAPALAFAEGAERESEEVETDEDDTDETDDDEIEDEDESDDETDEADDAEVDAETV